MAIRDEQTALKLFRSAATAHAAATETGEYKVGNRAQKQLMKALKWLVANEATHLLHPLLDSSDVGPCTWAAAYLLAHQGDSNAEKALIKVAAEDNIHGFGAEMTLKEWRAGRLKLPV